MTPKQRKIKIEQIKELLTKNNFNQDKRYPHLFYNKDRTCRFKFTATKVRKERKFSYTWKRVWSEYVVKIDLYNIPMTWKSFSK